MPNLTPAQKQMQDRFEALIGAAAPFLDLVLAVGDRISRIAEPTDHDYYPIRSGEQLDLPGEAGGDHPGRTEIEHSAQAEVDESAQAEVDESAQAEVDQSDEASEPGAGA